MRVKVDEDLPKAAVQMLQQRGYQALSVIEQGMGGQKIPTFGKQSRLTIDSW